MISCSQHHYYLVQILVFLLLGLFYSSAHADWQSEEAAIMGTVIRVEVWHESADVRTQGIDSVLDEMERVNRLMSPYIEESQLSKINQYAHEGPVEIDQDLFDVIARSLQISDLSDGAFDITYASVGHLFNYRKEVKPTKEEIEHAKSFVDYNNVILDKEQLTISFLKQGVKIDLGGIAKGFAVDRSIRLLKEHGIKHALVSAGGDTRLLGDRRGRPWLVGIRDPENKAEVVVMLPLEDEALSTSGDYERFFIEDGIKYHHIIQPTTGKSASEVRSVSILAQDSMTSDALSTSVFVMGSNKGLELLNRLDGIEGVIIDQKGKLFYSVGLQQDENHSKTEANVK